MNYICKNIIVCMLTILYLFYLAHDHSPSLVHKIEYDQTSGNMLIAGNFSSAGSLSCSGVCVLDTTNHQWNTLGDGGVTGEALDFVYTGVSRHLFKYLFLFVILYKRIHPERKLFVMFMFFIIE